jgi:ketosteroid isomerase-like protein
MLERWRQAWSRRDVDAYLSSYSADFVPADGATRSAWAEGRRKNLLGRSRIDVQLRDIKLSPQADGQVKVSLLQDYASDHYRETSRPKTLLLIREGGGWRIAREWQEAQGAR